MEAREKILTIVAVPWSEEAGRWLASTLRGVPCFGVDDYRREVESNPDCKLFRISDHEAALVGFVVLRIERGQHGAEGSLLAAAGKLGGARLYGQVLPALEKLFSGVVSFRADPCRGGAIKHLLAAGYLPTHVTMRKAAPMPRGPRRELVGDDLMAALAQAGADEPGGPSIQARPGKLHKVSASQSSTTQQTTQIDRRQVVDNGGIGIAGESAVINMLDAGAVSSAFDFAESTGASALSFAQGTSGAALDFARAADVQTGKTLSETLNFAGDVFEQGLGVLDKAGRQIEAQTTLIAKAYDSSGDLIARAYDDAKGEGTQKTIIGAAALAVVAIVAIRMWK